MVFDLDGTLVDTEALTFTTYQQAADRLGFTPSAALPSQSPIQDHKPPMPPE